MVVGTLEMPPECWFDAFIGGQKMKQKKKNSCIEMLHQAPHWVVSVLPETTLFWGGSEHSCLAHDLLAKCGLAFNPLCLAIPHPLLPQLPFLPCLCGCLGVWGWFLQVSVLKLGEDKRH